MMSRKVFAQVLVLVLLLLAFFGTPLSAQAGGVCGGIYIVESGETLDTIAATCGTSAAAITAANPGISGSLYAGQALTVPGSNYTVSSVPVTSTIVSGDTYNYNTYNYNTYNNYNSYSPAVTYSNGTYIVQYGDTFSGIASRYGLSINQLWAANPQIWNINYLYAGQAIYIPTSSGQTGYTSTAELQPLSYGTVPAGTAYGAVRLVNKSGGDVYVSLQGTTRDGVSVIYEYPVSGTMKAKVPVGWYVYVAWVGGVEYVGQFNLSQDGDHSIIFRNNGATVE
jgi:LysM repeat protein